MDEGMPILDSHLPGHDGRARPRPVIEQLQQISPATEQGQPEVVQDERLGLDLTPIG